MKRKGSYVNWRVRVVKYVTLFVVLVLIMNPDTVHLGLFVDAAGLDILILLLEAQVLVISMAVYEHSIKPVIAVLWGNAQRSRLRAQGIFTNCARSPGLMLTGEATLMHLLVISTAVCMLCNS